MPAAQRSSPKTVPKTESYATWIIGTDVATLAILSAGAFAATPEVALVGLGTYLVAPAIVHGVQGNLGGAALSVVTRVSIPFVVGALALETARHSDCPLPDEDPDEWRCDRQQRYALIGVGVGILTAMALDAAFIARRPVREQKAFVIAPTASWSNQGWDVGLQGRF